MDFDSQESSSEEQDVKPIILPMSKSCGALGLSPSFSSSPKTWSLCSLQDSNRKSAFQPYKQTLCTVLTNLQRGNTQAETPVPQYSEINFHTRAGQGEITEQDIRTELSVNSLDSNGLTALHWAASYGQYNTIQLLLNCGAETDALGPDEETPLMLAANGGHHEIVRLLITKGKANVNHEDHLCNTALMYAAKTNHHHCCQELLLHGADFSIVNFNDDTAYDIAIANNSVEAQYVIEKFIISRLEAA